MEMTSEAGWLADPKQPGRLRYWDGSAWTAHVSDRGVQSVDPFEQYAGTRWQYAVVNIGSFGAIDRMRQVLGEAGAQGWELISVYDKASNWFQGMEKGFMLLKRPVAPEVEIGPDDWCITLNMAG